MGYAWNGMSYQESIAGSGAAVFALSLLIVFLILAALYESWSLPWSVLLSTPVAVAGAFFGIWARGLENNVYAQIGLLMLIGLVGEERDPDRRVREGGAREEANRSSTPP